MKRRSEMKTVTIILLIFISVSLFSCSEKLMSPGGEKVELRIDTTVQGLSDATQATSFILTVTGMGIPEPLIAELAYSNGLLTGSVMVPAGPARTFRLEAFDQGGVLLYRGTTIADVIGGSSVTLRIPLEPVAPMIKLTPIYLETLQGAQVAVKISVFNINNLNRLQFELSNWRQVGNNYISADHVEIAPEVLERGTVETYETTSGEQNFLFDGLKPDIAIVDENGYTHLATVYYNTHIYEVVPYETVDFNLLIISMRDTEGYLIPGESVYRENSTILLWDTYERLVARWNMGYGQNSEDQYWIEDSTENQLHGRSSGTFISYGVYGDAHYFDGKGSFASIPDDPLLDVEDGITFIFYLFIGPLLPQGIDVSHPSLAADLPAPAQPVSFSKNSIFCKGTEGGPIAYQLMIEDTDDNDGYFSFLFRYGSSSYHVYRVDVPDYMMNGWSRYAFSFRYGDPSSAMLAYFGEGIGEYEGEWIAGTGLEKAPSTNSNLLMAMQDSETNPMFFEGGLQNIEMFDIAVDIEILYSLYW